MKTKVGIQPQTLKHLHTLGPVVVISVLSWMADVQDRGLEAAKKIPDHEDRPVPGRPGLRSVKITNDFRAYYRVVGGNVIIEEINQYASN